MKVISRLFLIVAIGMVPASLVAQQTSQAVSAAYASDEIELLEILEDVMENRLPQALRRAEALVKRNPKFRLASLVLADLYAAQTAPIRAFGGAHADRSDDVAKLLDEARKRLTHRQREQDPAHGGLPAYLLQVPPSQKQVVVVDALLSRAHVYTNNNGKLELLRDYYVSIGANGIQKQREGDRRTPVGVYFIASRLDPSGLGDLYGTGALTINYPNEWDTRLDRTGYGIWLHGVPSATYNRAPLASDGCLALPNDDMSFLFNTPNIEDTPVIIADSVEWTSLQAITDQRQSFLTQFESWRRDWESLDSARYERHYSRFFNSGDMDHARWVNHKRRVAKKKTFVKVDVSDVSVFGYPGEKDLLVVTFNQDYRSSNFDQYANKRQYWKKETDGQWKIVYENKAKYLPIHYRGIPSSARRLASAE